MTLGQFVERDEQVGLVVDHDGYRKQCRLVLSDGSITGWQDADGWKGTRLPFLMSAWMVPFMNAVAQGRTSVCTAD